MYKMTTYDQEPEGDIVDDLLAADQQNKKALEGAMTIGTPKRSLFQRAAEEIIKLRTVLGMTEN